MNSQWNATRGEASISTSIAIWSKPLRHHERDFKDFYEKIYKITYCNINCMNNVQLLNVLEPMRIFINHFPFATLIQMKLDTFQCLLSYCKAGVWVKKLINILIHTKTIKNLELKSNESYVVSTVSFPYYSKL